MVALVTQVEQFLSPAPAQVAQVLAQAVHFFVVVELS
jgi:hypothetical protein